MFKKVYGLLLLFILVTSSIGCVSAKHYTYNVNVTQYETFNLDDWMDNNDISSFWLSSFARSFYESGYFLVSRKDETSMLSDLLVTSYKIGSGRLTVEYVGLRDSDYIDFVVNPRSA